jgi:hypothetical protein
MSYLISVFKVAGFKRFKDEAFRIKYSIDWGVLARLIRYIKVRGIFTIREIFSGWLICLRVLRC